MAKVIPIISPFDSDLTEADYRGLDVVQEHARMAARFLRGIFNGQEAGFVCLFNKPSKHSTFVAINNQDWYSEAA
jgi:hypothetical protein